MNVPLLCALAFGFAGGAATMTAIALWILNRPDLWWPCR